MNTTTTTTTLVFIIFGFLTLAITVFQLYHSEQDRGHERKLKDIKKQRIKHA